VFSVTPAGAETVLAIFNGGSGDVLTAGLVDVGDKFYGTTRSSGANGSGAGIVFKMTPSGVETVLHTFGGSPDGAQPVGGLIKVGKLFYGTTETGGTGTCNLDNWPGCGTVFSITAGGSLKVVHSFQNNGDGLGPTSSLINVNGTLYGTTGRGGAYGFGTVFSITPSGSEEIIYSFKGGSDGATPNAGLLYVDGAFYGTTAIGGAGACQTGCGTAFSVTTTGAKSLLYAFKGGDDGAAPDAALIHVNGMFYGTTAAGGASSTGTGTVFAISKKGSEAILHSFQGGSDGSEPLGALINVGGILYGTTFGGGSTNCGVGGCGTVFAITP
jgi:uncharacterized repeat protein (TIGR03803 family)